MPRRPPIAALTVLVLVAAAPSAARAATPLADAVDTRVGTDAGAADFGTGGGAGATIPGATAPFGMVQLSPDTVPSIENFGGHYTYRDTRLRGFSATHLSGAGCAALADVPILPTTAPVTRSPATLASFDVADEHVASFSHAGEVARAGDYRVRMQGARGPIDAELTATTRTGAARFTFPAGAPASVLLNAGGSATGDFADDVRIDPVRREVAVTVTSGAFCSNRNRYTLHVVARFDRPFGAYGTWQRQALRPGATSASDRATLPQLSVVGLQYAPFPGGPAALPGNPSSGAQAGAYLTFDTRAGRAVGVRIGVSLVSTDGARRNLDAEAGDRGFDALRAAARATWQRTLERVRVRGGAPADRALFTTLLYHALVAPNTVSDVDGRYPGLDGRVHRAEGYAHLSNISGWDVYRTQVPLLAMAFPARARDLAHTLVDDFRDSGHLPKWPVQGADTNVMVGDPADIILAGIRAFGVRDTDLTAALHAAVSGATRPGVAPSGYVQRPGLADLLRLGYVGYERNTDVIGHTIDPGRVWGSAATTLEYATADFAIARLAAEAGDTRTCRTFAARAGNWRNVVDPVSGYARPRRADGSWVRQDDPATQDGFVEGSAAQYTWAVPQDVAGLVGVLGGRAAVARRLADFLSVTNAGPNSTKAFLGNEPTLHVPALTSWVGAPAIGQRATRTAMRELYALTPTGYPGNDDLGTMSAWWVLNALGLQPAVPGTGVLVLGAPLFPRADVRLGRRTLRIRAEGAAPDAAVVRGVRLRGRRHAATWVDWRSLARGGELRVRVAREAGRWGTAPSAAPPSFGGDAACAPLPRAR